MDGVRDCVGAGVPTALGDAVMDTDTVDVDVGDRLRCGANATARHAPLVGPLDRNCDVVATAVFPRVIRYRALLVSAHTLRTVTPRPADVAAQENE